MAFDEVEVEDVAHDFSLLLPFLPLTQHQPPPHKRKTRTDKRHVHALHVVPLRIFLVELLQEVVVDETDEPILFVVAIDQLVLWKIVLNGIGYISPLV